MPLYTPPTPSPAPPTRPWPTPTPWPTPPTRPSPAPTPWPKPPTTPWPTPPTRPCPTRPEETTPTVLTLLEPTPWVVLGWSATAATGDPKALDWVTPLFSPCRGLCTDWWDVWPPATPTTA